MSKLLIVATVVLFATAAYAQNCTNGMNCTRIGNQTFCTCY
jgi:hypothetical protein